MTLLLKLVALAQFGFAGTATLEFHWLGMPEQVGPFEMYYDREGYEYRFYPLDGQYPPDYFGPVVVVAESGGGAPASWMEIHPVGTITLYPAGAEMRQRWRDSHATAMDGKVLRISRRGDYVLIRLDHWEW